MYTAYLLILTMYAGAGEIIDPNKHRSLGSCETELVTMQEVVRREWAHHGILRMKGECRLEERGNQTLAESDIDH